MEKPIDENIETYPPIYTKSAVSGFAILFAPIFGGIMLMQNLIDIGRKRDANMVLLFSIIYTAIAAFIINIPEKSFTSLSLVFNLIGSQILISLFFKKHIPDETIYPKKKIWKPLIIGIGLLLIIFLAAFFVSSYIN
jgi:hypothetical protein